jgi:hypothetical protein
LLRYYEPFIYISIFHALANSIGLTMVAINYALAWRACAEARETCFAELMGAAISCVLIWLSVPFVFPIKVVLWLAALYVEMRNGHMFVINHSNNMCFAGLGNAIPLNITPFQSRMGEFVCVLHPPLPSRSSLTILAPAHRMLIIGEGMLSIVLGLDSRRSDEENTCRLTQACCALDDAPGLEMPSACKALASGHHLLLSAGGHGSLDCEVLHRSKCSALYDFNSSAIFIDLVDGKCGFGEF